MCQVILGVLALVAAVVFQHQQTGNLELQVHYQEDGGHHAHLGQHDSVHEPMPDKVLPEHSHEGSHKKKRSKRESQGVFVPHDTEQKDEEGWKVVGKSFKVATDKEVPQQHNATPSNEKDNGGGKGAQVKSTGVGRYFSGVQFTSSASQLRKQLRNLLQNHRVLDYADVWHALEGMDGWGGEGCQHLQIKDVYSGKCWATKQRRCGRSEVHKEGDCYNREHSWPKSWWGGDFSTPASTDLMHIFLVDGYVNKLRGNLAMGLVQEADFESSSGAKIGTCTGYPKRKMGKGWERGTVKFFSTEKRFGFVEREDWGQDVFLHADHLSGGAAFQGEMVQYIVVSGKKGPAARDAQVVRRCFEPPREYKGDLARVYFYMSVAYEGEWGCCAHSGVDKNTINAWMETVLRQWHKEDPVSANEMRRNEEVYVLQGNRNPFVDHPDLVAKITDF